MRGNEEGEGEERADDAVAARGVGPSRRERGGGPGARGRGRE